MAITDSKLNMWRTIVALAHSDGVFHQSEENYLFSIFDSLDLSDEQKEILVADTKTAHDPNSFFDKITHLPDRSQLFYFGRIVLWADDMYTQDEEEAFNKLRELALGEIDMERALEKVDQVAEEFKAKEEARKENRPLHRKIIDALIFWEDLP